MMTLVAGERASTRSRTSMPSMSSMRMSVTTMSNRLDSIFSRAGRGASNTSTSQPTLASAGCSRLPTIGSSSRTRTSRRLSMGCPLWLLRGCVHEQRGVDAATLEVGLRDLVQDHRGPADAGREERDGARPLEPRVERRCVADEVQLAQVDRDGDGPAHHADDDDEAGDQPDVALAHDLDAVGADEHAHQGPEEEQAGEAQVDAPLVRVVDSA